MDGDADVIVIGAGLAGLRAATELSAAGRHVLVLEAADDVGGRIRTENVDGFLVDRGFQLLNPAYPAVRRWIDVEALALQGLGAGVAARTDGDRLRLLGHPLREPRLIAETLRSVRGEGRGVFALLRWLRPLLHGPRTTSLSAVQRKPDMTLQASLDAAGLDGVLRRIVERFFAGVLLDDEGGSSAAYARLLTAMFVLGVPGLPAAGMQALPRQLAAGLGGQIRCNTPVTRVRRTGAGFTIDIDGGSLKAERVVLAVGPPEVAELAGGGAVATRGVVTEWWAADTRPSASTLLHVDARAVPSGPLVNTAVISNAAPTYAPPGRYLVQGSALMGRDRRTPGEAEMRRHAGDLLGCSSAGWRSVARHEVVDALPVQAAPLVAARPMLTDDGLVVCGDHRDTASIQGALVSGHRAARLVLSMHLALR